MSESADIGKVGERLGRPLAVSAGLHAALFVGGTLWAAFHAPLSLGDESALTGGAVPVKIMQGVPLNTPRARVENPVANPVRHTVPNIEQPPTPQPPQPAEDPAAVPIEKERKRRRKPPSLRKPEDPAPNQLSSSTGAAVSSPLYTGQEKKGSGGINFGSGSPFGARFGWYAEALQRRLSEEWGKTLGQVSGGSPRAAVVSFRILRNGRVDRIRVTQSSGNRSLDYSAVRATTNCNPLRPLPPALGRSFINVEMWFQLR